MNIIVLCLLSAVVVWGASDEQSGCSDDTACDATSKIPTISFRSFILGDKATRKEIAAEIKHALTTTGFFRVKDHGISRDTISRVFNSSKTFFERPDEEKVTPPAVDLIEGKVEKKTPGAFFTANREHSYQGDQKNNKEEYAINYSLSSSDFDWNELLPEEFNSHHFFEYSIGLKLISNEILRAYALALDIDEEFFVSTHRSGDGTWLLFNHYAPLVEEYKNELLLPPHSDYLTITLGFQDDIGGLQVWDRANAKWIDLEYDPDTLIVNTGDAMERWSNGEFVSNNHRVIPNTSNRDRYSHYFFVGPTDDTMVDARDTGFNDNAKWEAIRFDELLLRRMKRAADFDTFHEQEHGDHRALKTDL